MRTLLFAIALLVSSPAVAEPRAVLVTIDGLRWQEAFHGADPELAPSDARAGATLMPFLNSFAREGALIGDRRANSCMHVENRYWFSYPGYTEMLAGRPNPHIRRNGKIWNKEITTLEWLNGRDAFRDRVRIFAEWGKVPYILNTRRSNLPVTIAEQSLALRDPPTMEAALTMFAAPTRVAWIDLGDTDTRAHDGDYAGVLDAAAKADAFLADLWAKFEADPAWAGQTTLIVTVDHGRGANEDGKWKGHGSGRLRGVKWPVSWPGSDATWIAARGPTIAPGAGAQYTPDNCATTAQVAATLLKSLGEDPALYRAEDLRPALEIFR
jgi:hypothetical protein